MNTSQTYIDLIRMHQSELQERFGITSMRLFGSVARGDHQYLRPFFRQQIERDGIDIFITA
jgi:predicted nucleotidyltransferase